MAASTWDMIYDAATASGQVDASPSKGSKLGWQPPTQALRRPLVMTREAARGNCADGLNLTRLLNLRNSLSFFLEDVLHIVRPFSEVF